MIGVVGGGLAGLASAYALRQRGHEVRVFEAGDDLGGLASTYETAGDPLERYYHHLSRTDETIVDLICDLGLDDRLEWRVGKTATYVDGVVHPLNTPWEILAYPPLSLYDTIRLAMLTKGIDVRGGRVRSDAYDDLEAYDDVPADEFLFEHTTRGVYENFWRPLLEAKFGSRARDVSAAWVLGRVQFRSERDLLRGEVLGSLDGSVAVLVDALVDAVGRENVVTGARVTDLEYGDDVESLTVEYDRGRDRGLEAKGERGGALEAVGVGDGELEPADGGDDELEAAGEIQRRDVDECTDGGKYEREPGLERERERGRGRSTETHEVDAVIVATMPDVLESLTGYASGVEFQGTICSVFSAETSLTDTYWCNVTDEAPFDLFVEHTNFVPPGRYGGDHCYYLARYVQDLESAAWQRSDAEIERRWLAGVSDLFPQFDRNDLNWIETARNPRTAPVYECGYLEKVVPYDLREAVTDGVYYAGMASRAQYPERSLNGAIEAGFACAERIADRG